MGKKNIWKDEDYRFFQVKYTANIHTKKNQNNFYISCPFLR